jgi:aspartate-semialdehyde dehydrogenase
MATSLESRRIVIAGASSLLGTELKALLEESRFAASEFRLVDEESVAGLLTEAGGEPAVIQPVEADSFNKAWIVFFVGSPAFTRRNLELAKGSGAHIVDLSGELAGDAATRLWLPNFAELPGAALVGAQHAAPQLAGASSDDKIFAVPSAPAEIIARLGAVLRSLDATALTAVAFQPISASGKAGIEELETQTGQLLSFQPAGKAVFDAQVAFTMLDRFGPSSAHKLQAAQELLRKEVRASLPAGLPATYVQLLHAPVFYGTTVSAFAKLDSSADAAKISKACVDAGFTITTEDAAPSNISSAGETVLQLAPPQTDSAAPGAWWFWAAADNVRVPAANAIKLAEKLLVAVS